MNLAFYYHVPIKKYNDALYLPGYLAVFIESLALEVDTLTLFLHTESNKSLECDTKLIASNITWIDMGVIRSAWHRSLFSGIALKPVIDNLDLFDIILVRCPSPLAPYFKNYISKEIVYMLVGDYEAGIRTMKIKNLRDYFVKLYTLQNHRHLMSALKGSIVLPNSQLLYNKVMHLTNRLKLIKTTTLTLESFHNKVFFNYKTNNRTIHLLYTGRIVSQKGLDIIIDAVKSLITKGYNLHFNIAGFIVKGAESYLNYLKEKSFINSKSFLTFHGYLKSGIDLDKLYRNADIFIIASTSDFEGFPRSIWEALANRCPVIATKVGSIPYFLEDKKHALLIEPQSVKEIEVAIEKLISDLQLVEEITNNGYELALENTVDKQSKHLVNIIKSYTF